MLSLGTMSVWAQRQIEAHLGADIVSNYIWRGQDLGHVSLQPELSVAWKGLSLAAWGNVGLSDKDDAREVDLTLSYETGGLSFGIVDYWNDANDSRYFYYKKDGTGHSFEGFVAYDFGPVKASWQTRQRLPGRRRQARLQLLLRAGGALPSGHVRLGCRGRSGAMEIRHLRGQRFQRHQSGAACHESHQDYRVLRSAPVRADHCQPRQPAFLLCLWSHAESDIGSKLGDHPVKPDDSVKRTSRKLGKFC